MTEKLPAIYATHNPCIMNTNEPYVCVSSRGMLSIAHCVEAYFSQAVCLMADYLIEYRVNIEIELS